MGESMLERRLDGARIYSGRVVNLEVDRVVLPTGAESVREVVRHRGAAVILPLLEDGRVVLVRQYRYPVGEALLELPAGTLETGEDPLECAKRELTEETGYRTDSLVSLGRFFAAPGYTDECLVPVLATALTPAGGPDPDPDEIIEVVTLTTDELLRAIEAGEIRDSKTLATILLAQLKGAFG